MRIYRDTDELRLYRDSTVEPNGCVYFARSLKEGYGVIGIHTDDGRVVMTGAHIVAWELVNGPVPSGEQIDHLCHDPQECRLGQSCSHRRCINPTHLALASHARNHDEERAAPHPWSLLTHCKNNHEFTDENTYHRRTGGRACRQCKRASADRNKVLP